MRQFGKRILLFVLMSIVFSYSRVSALRGLTSPVSRNRFSRLFSDIANSKGTGRTSAAVTQAQQKNSSAPKGKLDLNPPKGTRDFYPDDKRLNNWLFNIWRKIALQYGFEEYDAPVLENEQLYIRKAGEEVTEQLYNFEDKGGRRLSLRPEMTPSLARMIMAKKGSLPFPIKWFAIPQCWRYERTTLGRRREHYQWNMDIWGVEGVEAEAELLSAITRAFTEMGLGSEDVGIKVNSRKILSEIVALAGVPNEKFAATCVLIDKLEKLPLESLSQDFLALGLRLDVVQTIVQHLTHSDIEYFSTLLGPESAGVQDMKQLYALASCYGFKDWLVFDPTVVRGLAYYTGVVFEGFDRKAQFRAICGGGRYDTLLETFGDEKTPAVGFGFGDAVIVELLKSKGLLPDSSQSTTQIVAYTMSEDLREKACQTVSQLRDAGYSVDFILGKKKPKWAFQHADRLKAAVVVMFAEDEFAKGQVVVKRMADGQQSTEDLSNLITSLGSIIKSAP